MKRTIAIIQARMSSERLPQKVLATIYEKKQLLQIVVERIRRCKEIDEVVIATSTNPEDDAIQRFCLDRGVACFRGSLGDVLERFYECASYYQADIVLRFTGDNVMVDSTIVRDAIHIFNENAYDYLYYKDGLPIGMAVEVCTYEALKRAHQNATNVECREHVTLYMYRNPKEFRCFRYGDGTVSDLRLTVDTMQDLMLVRSIYAYFGHDHFTYEELLEAYSQHPEWRKMNSGIVQKVPKYRG